MTDCLPSIHEVTQQMRYVGGVTHNTSTQEVEAGDKIFRVILGYIAN